MDIALQTLSTPHRRITVLDAPGHRDFVPNMISGATQADAALLVVDSSTGEFESGFDRGGQTREHLVLVRSLGVSQVIVAVNKMDMVDWGQDRFSHICGALQTFLAQTGFSSSKASFVPVGASSGVNLVHRDGDVAHALRQWYNGPTLVDLLDKLEAPQRMLNGPLRLPLSNVFRGQNALASGVGVSGRICSGILQAGERLRVLPGDETAVVRMIEHEDKTVPWAAAGSNVTLYLAGIDQIHLSIGSVLCPVNELVPLATVFKAKIVTFDLRQPIINGASVELFHQAREVAASVTKLLAIVDRASGAVLKQNPRVLPKYATALVQIALRTASLSGSVTRAIPLALEPVAVNKDMSRILLRSGGETIAAGLVTEIVE